VAIALVENIQREDLTLAEEARALQRLVADFQLTHQAVADAVGRSRAAVSNLIRRLDLPAEVVALVDSKALGMRHARSSGSGMMRNGFGWRAGA
jgi:ParB family chromosome partitioning protein